jgi:hypothetical protein
MLTAVITVVLTFVLTGIVGNLLIHRWQLQSWISQQRFLGQEKEYFALQDLFEEIVTSAGRRITRMRRLLRVLHDQRDDLVRQRLKDYDTVQTAWNDSLSSFLVRLRMYAPYSMATRLDEVIQGTFVRLGSELEHLTDARLSGRGLDRARIGRLDLSLNELQGEIIMFTRDMLNLIKLQRTKTYTGTRVTLREHNLELFPTWELLKALFQPRKERFSIVRTSADLEPPRSSWD